LEEIDRHIVRPLHDALRQQGEYRILISPDHPTPLRTKTHSHGHVPFAIAGAGIDVDGESTYDELACERSGLKLDEGHRLMSLLLDAAS
ncbi:MAG: phosphoglycerate mutase, partial [Planctomycetales bacterium]|nr:phosphoglycerate mutase [Planctomycetales bacterium]